MRYLLRALPVATIGVFLFTDFVQAQRLGFVTGREPHGVDVYEMAMTPSVRKWQYPQSLYNFYQWTGEEYSNYARENYERYVSTELEGFRTYDMYGNYITRGFEVYDWTIDNPVSSGSEVRKGPKYSSWFSNLVVSSMSKGQFYSSMTIGEAIRTTLTPLTFSKPAFNGVQWDFASDKYQTTMIASRLASPGTRLQFEVSSGQVLGDMTNLFGMHNKVQLGDFSNVGFTYLNIGNYSTGRKLGENSLQGVLTESQNGGNIETIVLRISDDSPEDGRGGAQLFAERIIIDGVDHPEIVPSPRGGVRRAGVIEANGADALELTYNISRDFRQRPDDQITTFQEIRKIEFELVIANDYKVDITSNLQVNAQGEPVFLTIERAHGNVSDGSNQRFIRFEYGLPTGKDIIGLSFDVDDVKGFNLRSEVAISRDYRRFPNQNFQKHELAKQEGLAYYLTASQDAYPWFAYGEIYRMEPEYRTNSFITDARGFVDYEAPERYTFEMVDDNDDQDRFPDWKRLWQNGDFAFGESPFGVGGQADPQVFPGYDENADFISDFNQNSNGLPDFSEPFLRYNVDPPEFLFGVDMNNNSVIDRFENDVYADYPYRKDRDGYNLYGGVNLNEHLKLTMGQTTSDEISSRRESEMNYAILTGQWNWPGIDLRSFHYARSVRDDIKDDVVQWVDPEGFTEVVDPLIAQDTFIYTGYVTLDYLRLKSLKVYNKVKYDIYKQRGEQAETKDDRLFLGVINRLDYPLPLTDNLSFWPRWKSIYRKINPTFSTELDITEWSQFYMLTSKYFILPTTFIEYGVEWNLFNNLEKRPEILPPGYVDDFTGTVLAFQLSNRSAYLGYSLTMNTGFRWERRAYEVDTETNSLLFIRVFAGLQQ
ncbi:MAG: hypothetical protein VX294_11490 [Candidatus Latescibacterota bacterium]|nr:hypothetical protein [Candidatus Latescibacterota bacterium]